MAPIWQAKSASTESASEFTVDAVVLAAGMGVRMGGPKALARDGERTFLEHVIETLRVLRVRRIAVALPAGHLLSAPGGGDDLVTVLGDARGPLFSARAAMEALGECAAPILLWPVDHPTVEARTVDALISAACCVPPGTSRVVPRHERGRGHPILLTALGVRAVIEAPADSRATLRDVLAAAGSTVEIPTTDERVLRNRNHPEPL